MNKSSLKAEEITALTEVNWSAVSNLFITGNHESDTLNLNNSSINLMRLRPNTTVIDSPQSFMLDGENTQICFLPYITATNETELIIDDYFPNIEKADRRIVFSHNDLKGIQMGQFISKKGFGIENIEKFCDLFINGHLHNGAKISDKIINLGNACGQDFNEDAFRYSHNVAVLDTETLKLDYYENPEAFNFYKLYCNSVEELNTKLNKLKDNAVVWATVPENNYSEMKELINSNKKVVCSRVTIQISATNKKSESDIDIQNIKNIDYEKEFSNFIFEKLGYSDTLKEELQEVFK